MPRPVLVLLLCCVASACVGNRPALIQGLIGVTAFDEIDFTDGNVPSTPSTATLSLDALPTIGFALQKPVNFSAQPFDVGLEGGANLGWDTERIAFVAGGGGAVVDIRANLVFFDLFAGGYVGKTFDSGFRVFAGAGPLILWAWASSTGNVDPADEFDDSSSELGTYVRAGIEFDIGPAGTLGLTIQRIDSSVDFTEVGSADVDGTYVTVSLTRWM